jgi:nitroreductase
MTAYKEIPYPPLIKSEEEIVGDAKKFLDIMKTRRSVRRFSTKPVPRKAIFDAIQTAGTAPSGANKQPWTFCVIDDPELKLKIRRAAEQEEFKSYNGRMNEEWLKDLEPLGTNHVKPFLEDAPFLIVVFKKSYTLDEGERKQNYYVNESVGIAVGMLLSALHFAGLATLTHTPSPMNFLSELLNRPQNEKAYMLIPVGYAHPETTVPDLKKKPLNEILFEYF